MSKWILFVGKVIRSQLSVVFFVLVFWLFSGQGQYHEALRIELEKRHSAAILASFFAMATFLWFWSTILRRELAWLEVPTPQSSPGDGGADPPQTPAPLPASIRQHIVFVLVQQVPFMLGFVLPSWFFLGALNKAEYPQAHNIGSAAEVANAYRSGVHTKAIVAFVCFALIQVLWSRARWEGRSLPSVNNLPKNLGPYIPPLTALFFSVGLVGFIGWPFELGQWFGTPAVVHIAILCWMCLIGTLVLAGKRASELWYWLFDKLHLAPGADLTLRRPFTFPVLPVIALCALTLGWHDCKDSRVVQLTPEPEPAEEELSTTGAMRQRFEATIENEPPNVVVAAEGGGIHAAYRAAMFLARMEQIYPGFYRRIAFTSSVSGGSVGVAIYVALLDIGGDGIPRTNPKEMVEKTRKVFDQDWMTPLLGRMLATDLFCQLLPWPISHPDTDRSKALTIAIRKSVQKVLRREDTALDWTLRQAYSRGLPCLLFNTSSVQQGDRFVLAPFTIAGVRDLPSYTGVEQGISVLDAACLSARFPVFLTPGRIPLGCGNERVVDGGYVDNSGLGTASRALAELLDVKRESGGYLRARASKGNSLRMQVIAIASSDPTLTRTKEVIKLPGRIPLVELFSPVITAAMGLLQYNSTSFASIESFLLGLSKDTVDQKAHLKVASATFEPTKFITWDARVANTPLGWSLSAVDRNQLSNQLAANDAEAVESLKELVQREKLSLEKATELSIQAVTATQVSESTAPPSGVGEASKSGKSRLTILESNRASYEKIRKFLQETSGKLQIGPAPTQ
jgi:hypothetical protein